MHVCVCMNRQMHEEIGRFEMMPSNAKTASDIRIQNKVVVLLTLRDESGIASETPVVQVNKLAYSLNA